MRLRVFIRSVVMDLRAWRRGERRIAPRGVRGRVYEKRNEAGGAHEFDQKTKFTLYARIIRATETPTSSATSRPVK